MSSLKNAMKSQKTHLERHQPEGRKGGRSKLACFLRARAAKSDFFEKKFRHLYRDFFDPTSI